MVFIRQRSIRLTRFPVLLACGMAVVVLNSADVGSAACRHRGLSADDVLRLVQEQSRSARPAPTAATSDAQSPSQIDDNLAALWTTYIVPLPCDDSAPPVRSVVSTAVSALPVPCGGGTTPQITWHVPYRSCLHSLHVPQALAPPPRA